MVAAGVEVDPLQRRKLSQKEAVMVQLEQAAPAIAEEEARVTMEQWQQQQQQQQQQLLLEKQQQQHQEHQHQLFQQEVCQSPNIAAYSWLPGTQVQVIGGMAPTCNEHGQQVQQLQWLQACPMPVEQPAVVEHLQVPLQVFPACKEPNVSSQEGAVHHDVHQHHVEDVRRAVPKDMHEDMVVAAIPAPSCGGVDMLMESLSGDSEAKTHALASLRGSVAFHAFESQGCRVVQLAFQVADTRVATELLSELKGSVRAATRSPHGNYVIQKAIAVMPPAACSFIVEEICGAGVAVARHRYGCRILCRLLEHMAASPVCAKLIAEVLTEARHLSLHEFGHYVMESVLEHGQPQQRGCLVKALILEAPILAGHSCASHVVETALRQGSIEEQQILGAALLATGPDGMVKLALTQYGSFVARTLMRCRVDAAFAVAEQLRYAGARLQRSKHGRRAWEEALQAA